MHVTICVATRCSATGTVNKWEELWKTPAECRAGGCLHSSGIMKLSGRAQADMRIPAQTAEHAGAGRTDMQRESQCVVTPQRDEVCPALPAGKRWRGINAKRWPVVYAAARWNLTIGRNIGIPMLILYHNGSKAEGRLEFWPEDWVWEAESDWTNQVPLRGEIGRVTTVSLSTSVELKSVVGITPLK